jgi:hypothetical protein
MQYVSSGSGTAWRDGLVPEGWKPALLDQPSKPSSPLQEPFFKLQENNWTVRGNLKGNWTVSYDL